VDTENIIYNPSKENEILKFKINSMGVRYVSNYKVMIKIILRWHAWCPIPVITVLGMLSQEDH
jgi:hypothetical protein